MEFGLKGRAAVVCAASKGVGKAIALGLAREGVHVAICARGRETLEQAAEEIRQAAPVEVLAVTADLTHGADIQTLIEQAVERFGGIDILVTNAGGPPAGRFAELDEQQWVEAFELNLLSAIRCIRHALPSMRRRGRGRIINLSSISVKEPIDGLILSNTLRPSIIGLAKTLSRELGPDGITVNTVCLGRVLTDRMRSLVERRARDRGVTVCDMMETMKGEIPLGRFGIPEDVAQVVVFLASRLADYLTGCVIPVDGGLVRSI